MHAAKVPSLKGIGAVHADSLEAPRVIGQWLESQMKSDSMRLDGVYMFGRNQVADTTFVNVYLDNESLPVIQSSTGSPRRVTTEYEYADDCSVTTVPGAFTVHKGFWKKSQALLDKMDPWLVSSTNPNGITFVGVGPVATLVCCIAIGFKLRHPSITSRAYCFGGLPLTDSNGWKAVRSMIDLRWIVAVGKVIDEVPLLKCQMLEPPDSLIALHRGRFYAYTSEPCFGTTHSISDMLAYSGLAPSDITKYLQQWADSHPSAPMVPKRHRYSTVTECINRTYVSECYQQI